jgi:hypothetical protein
MKWIEASPPAVPDDLLELVGGNTLVAQVLARRGITDSAEAQAFLDPAYYQPTSSLEIPSMGKAVEILETAIQQGKLIGMGRF